jgi:hypothetical protein
MKTVGYMEGTESELLTRLTVAGHDTLPLSNGWDNHGREVGLLTPHDDVALIVGYLHKFLRITDERLTESMLSSVKIYKIPVVFIAPKDIQNQAEGFISNLGIKYSFVEPSEAYKAVIDALA